jgi:hypothetical protein
MPQPFDSAPLNFELKHQVAGRTRICWAGSREERDLIYSVAEKLTSIADNISVQVRKVTGSLIIEHPETDTVAILSVLEQLPIKFISPEKPNAIDAKGIELLKQEFDRLDHTLQYLSDNKLDINNTVFFALLSLALVQALRGQVLAPSSTLLWSALSLLRENQFRNV